MVTILKLEDKKGDKSRVSVHGTEDLSTELAAFMEGKTYAGGSEYSNVETGILGEPLEKDLTTAMFNDVDVKCVLSFRNVADPQNIVALRFAIPAPKSNVDGESICSRMGEEHRLVPVNKDPEEVGKDGATLASEIETLLGLDEGDVIFSSGVFTKVRA